MALKALTPALSVTVTIREDGGSCLRDGPQLTWAEHVVYVAAGGIVDRFLDHDHLDSSTDRQKLLEAKCHFSSSAVYETILRMCEREIMANAPEILKLARYMEKRSPGIFILNNRDAPWQRQ
jgi:hypothetical protein